VSTTRVLANHSFRKGQLNDSAVSKIVADVSKIIKSPRKPQGARRESLGSPETTPRTPFDVD
jgi:hypothetical protein